MNAHAALTLLLACATTHAAELHVIPTFESAGLYWKARFGSDDVPCEVRYRVDGHSQWREGYPLWFDGRQGEWGSEYRGSLVHLKPGTRYEVEVRAGDETAVAEFATWSEEFPRGPTHTLPEQSASTMVIRESGSENGWRIYEPAKGSTATIDVNDTQETCLRIEEASHIIIRGLTLRGASRHAITLVGDIHDVIIEDCDISQWGSVEADGWGRNYDSAVFSRSRTLRRIVIQHNRIHHPKGDSNSWAEHRPTPRDPENYHPGGPQAITLAQSRGNHVIRFNHVWSDDEHQFNDIFGAAQNYSTIGFPNCDSDIYGNRLSHCWDDAIESEGANRNVRVWGNHIDKAYVAVATATTSVGPMYVWRNVVGETRRSDSGNPDEIKRGAFLKTSDRMGGGRIHVFHNTLLQPPSPAGFRNTLGCQIGMGHGGNMSHVISRNNIFHTSERGGPFNDRMHDPLGDYDYDLFNGRLLIPAHERNGVVWVPTYARANGNDRTDLQLPRPFTPAEESPTIDAGVRLPNFNDSFTGRAPDLGAIEFQEELP
ncbi:MAG: right-handed parallel beta-helix repeat-containing protein [Maioricimonas sp. JB045]